MTKICIFQDNDKSILEIFKSSNQSRKQQNNDSGIVYFSKVYNKNFMISTEYLPFWHFLNENKNNRLTLWV